MRDKAKTAVPPAIADGGGSDFYVDVGDSDAPERRASSKAKSKPKARVASKRAGDEPIVHTRRDLQIEAQQAIGW